MVEPIQYMPQRTSPERMELYAQAEICGEEPEEICEESTWSRCAEDVLNTLFFVAAGLCLGMFAGMIRCF